jgi:hypothetical protein
MCRSTERTHYCKSFDTHGLHFSGQVLIARVTEPIGRSRWLLNFQIDRWSKPHSAVLGASLGIWLGKGADADALA